MKICNRTPAREKRLEYRPNIVRSGDRLCNIRLTAYYKNNSNISPQVCTIKNSHTNMLLPTFYRNVCDVKLKQYSDIMIFTRGASTQCTKRGSKKHRFSEW